MGFDLSDVIRAKQAISPKLPISNTKTRSAPHTSAGSIDSAPCAVSKTFTCEFLGIAFFVLRSSLNHVVPRVPSSA